MLQILSVLGLACLADGIVFTPVGRSYFSTDAKATADFFQRYLGAKSVPQNVTNNSACAIVESVTSGNITLTFVQDKVKQDGQIHGEAAVDALSAEWKNVMDRKKLYSDWFDNHDGYANDLFNVDQAYEDGLEMQVYHDDKAAFPAAVVRTRVPGTVWTLETAGRYSTEQAKKLEKSLFKDPDNCRNNSHQDNFTMPYWWKSTFATPDPAAAAEFAIAVLGATPSHGPYPWPEEANCTVAAWVFVPGSMFMLHFVKSTEWSSKADVNVDTWVKSQEDFRQLRAGQFDRQMYNALILWTEDLDPLIERLEELAVPFLPLQLGTDLYALQLDIPGNGISLQIRSNKLSKVHAKPFDACGSLDKQFLIV